MAKYDYISNVKEDDSTVSVLVRPGFSISIGGKGIELSDIEYGVLSKFINLVPVKNVPKEFSEDEDEKNSSASSAKTRNKF